ncbi:MAG: hypothetical protein Q4A29_03720 [Eubacteriales bacterium]|nr:hypothetical protein [Eubacteriales bacterium]
MNILIDENNRIIGFYDKEIKMQKIDDIPPRPEKKIGVEFVLFYDEQTNSAVYKELERPLTLEEEYQQKLDELNKEIEKAKEQAEKAERQAKIAKSQSLTALQAIGELAEERPSGMEIEVM